jgi:SAM-dependent methyltransferase
MPPARPHAPWKNTALLSQAEWEAAASQVEALGLPHHHDTPKDWDSLSALDTILERTQPSAHVLDAGGDLHSVILPWLALYGYQHLIAIDLIFPDPIWREGVEYRYGDITRTEFADQTFDAITCLSVVEHGVDLRAYFAEAARILKPGGVLITSTDYYPEPIDTQGKVAFGVPIHIFDRPEMEEILRLPSHFGLELTGPVQLECQERPIHWAGFDYTFLIFTLQKPARIKRDELI